MRAMLPLSLSLALFSSFSTASAADLTRSGGVIGGPVTFDMQGNPNRLFVLGFSFQAGCTIPLPPGCLELGLELFNQWQIGFLDGSGQASVAFNLPFQTTLHGLPFYSQLVTVQLPGLVAEELSALNAFVLGLPQDSTNTVVDRSDEIWLHSATTLDGGGVLLAGGISTDLLGLNYARDDYFIYDNQSGTFVPQAATMQETRSFHTATKLADGRVLTLGGADESFVIRQTGEIFDPATGTSTAITPMSVPRAGHTATLLGDGTGRVLVVGGGSVFDFTNPLAVITSLHKSSELYDPSTDTWAPGGSLPNPRGLHAASPLPSGAVLVTGGLESTFFGLVPIISNDARLYDPAANQFVGAGAFNGARALHQQITLSNGKVLIVGGVDGSLTAVPPVLATVGTSRLYDGSWSNVGSLAKPRAFHQIVEANGTVVAIGGIETFDIIAFSGIPLSEIETTDLSASTWTMIGNALLPRSQPRSVLFDGGDRILTTDVGDNGSGGSVPELTAEIYIP